MVSIEERQEYIEGLSNQPKQNALFALVTGVKYRNTQSDISETDSIYYSSVEAIKDNSIKDFDVLYSKISKRKLIENSTAPFIHDDFLIFTLIIGVSKFNTDKGWLVELVDKRPKNSVTTTFQNILSGNFLSKANDQSVILVFLYLLEKSRINNEMLIDVYDSIVNSHQSKDDFLKITQFRAFDIVIKLKVPLDSDDISRLMRFEEVFLKRIKTISILTYNTFLILLLFGAYEALQYLPEDKKLVVNDINLIIGIGALIGLSGNFISWFKSKIQDVLFRLFGYKKFN